MIIKILLKDGCYLARKVLEHKCFRRKRYMKHEPDTDEILNGIADFSDVRVVHVVRQYAPNIGGLEDVVRNLAAKQNGRFAGLKVVTLDRLFTDLSARLPGREIIDGIEVCRIPFRGSTRYPLAPSVLGEIKDADLVHVHAVDFFYDALALSRFWHRKTLVATTHGGFFHTARFARLKQVWFNSLTRLSSSQYSGIACCSQSDFDLFRKIAPRRTELIENGVDLEKFGEAASVEPRKTLLTLGRFSSNKRLNLLLDLMKSLSTSDDSWTLHVAGVESDLTKNDILSRAQSLGLGSQVYVHVGLSNQQLRDLIGQCSLFVSASDYEGFGLVLIEALSAGLIPVVHANQAFQSLSDSNPLIRLCDFEDVKKTAIAVDSALQDLLDDQSLRERAVQSVQRYGWPHTAKKYDDLYTRALRL